MQIPNADRTVIDPAKLRDYLLSSTHPVGRFKAPFFLGLGYTYAPVQCICLTFTNTSFLGSVDDDRTLMKRLEQRTQQIPVIDTCLAVLAAVQVVGVRRLALINPPFRAIGMIEALEEDLKRPVLTANQVLFWYALRRTGSSARVSGYGRVFDEQLPASV